jgi:predicted RNase H-like HicB family nuclease
MSAVHFDNYSQGRAHFRDLLDAARRGHAASVRRDVDQIAVVDAHRLRGYLASTVPQRARVVAEAGGWSVFIPGLPVAADGNTLDEAVDDMVDALREYATDWHDHLSDAPHHVDSWGIVQLIAFSDDDQLRVWLIGSTAPEAPDRVDAVA